VLVPLELAPEGRPGPQRIGGLSRGAKGEDALGEQVDQLQTDGPKPFAAPTT
jgi:hypothetical protein